MEMPDTPFELLFFAAFALYGLALAITLARPAIGRWIVLLGAASHLTATTLRGLEIDFFPLSNKMESFSAAALALALVALLTWKPRRIFAVSMVALTVCAMAVAARFPMGATFPPPLMITIWYPLHVPLSFLAYALWAAAAAAGWQWFR